MKVVQKQSQTSPDWGSLGAADSALGERAERVAKAIAEKMSPAGALGLPQLLDERRIRYGIPDEAFDGMVGFDRVLVRQVEPKFQEQSGERFAGSVLIRPDTMQKTMQKRSCRGVIVGAGLLALDQLRSNGYDLGHLVAFVRAAPWMMEVSHYGSEAQCLVSLRVGDLVWSEDLAAAIRNGDVRIERGMDGRHQFADKQGNTWRPELPFMDEST